jgi:hypothetical protein
MAMPLLLLPIPTQSAQRPLLSKSAALVPTRTVVPMLPSAAAILRMLEARVVAATCSSVKAVRAPKVVTLLHVAVQFSSVVVLDLAMSLLEEEEVKLKLHKTTSTYSSVLASGRAQG